MTEQRVLCVVETPKGSRNRYAHDPDHGAIRLDRQLFSSVSYPMDYGFVPETVAEDGDPLDVLVCVTQPTFPGCRIWGLPIGLFRTAGDDGPDDKLLSFPRATPTGAACAASTTCRPSCATRSRTSSRSTGSRRASKSRFAAGRAPTRRSRCSMTPAGARPTGSAHDERDRSAGRPSGRRQPRLSHLEVDVVLSSGACGRTAVPAGSSTGRYEARAARDGGEPWDGRGAHGAITAVEREPGRDGGAVPARRRAR